MKIFEIIYKDGERQWVAASTNIEALETVLSIEETDLSLMDEIKETSDTEYDTRYVLNNECDESDKSDWREMSFRDYLAKEVGKSASLIAATFYE